MNYKDPQNNLHDIEPAFAHLLPDGCIAITQEEADAIVASKVVPPTYQQLRAALYASIPDQLDMQYKDKINNTTMWVDHIKAVKDSIPKT